MNQVIERDSIEPSISLMVKRLSPKYQSNARKALSESFKTKSEVLVKNDDGTICEASWLWRKEHRPERPAGIDFYDDRLGGYYLGRVCITSESSRICVPMTATPP